MPRRTRCILAVASGAAVLGVVVLDVAGLDVAGLDVCGLVAPAHADIWPTHHRRVASALTEGEVTERRLAASRLLDVPPRLGRELAKKALDDEDVEVRLRAARAATSLGVEGAGDIVRGWLQERDARLRVAACDVIEASPSPNALRGLGRALGDAKPEVRRAAAAALGSSGRREAVSPLLGHLDDTAPAVRLEVVRALGRLGDERAVVPLISRLQDQEPSVRREAARALGRLGDDRATMTLLLALRDKEDSVRMHTLDALARLGAAEATASIAAMLDGAGDERVRGAVRRRPRAALARIGTEEAVTVLVEQLEREGPVVYGDPAPVRHALVRAGAPAVAALTRTLQASPSRRLASAAALVLGALQHPDGRDAIVRAARTGVASLEASLEALGTLGDSAGLPFVLEHLANPEARFRRVAAGVAARLLDPSRGDGRAVDVVRARVLDLGADIGERIALTRVLGQTGSPRAEDLLVTLAQSETLGLRAAALEALGKLQKRTEAGRGVLLEALDADEASVRRTASQALSTTGDSEAASRLLERLQNAAEQDRAAIGVALSGALAGVKDDGLARRIGEALPAATATVRDALLEGLGRMRAPVAREVLAQWAKGGDVDDRRKVAESLRSVEGAAPILATLLTDHDPSVRANAVWSLGHRGGPEMVTELLGAVADPDAAVAGNAALAAAKVAVRAAAGASVREALCRTLADPRPYVRVGALDGLRIAGSSCDGEVTRRVLRDEHWRVRLAAARALHARGGPGVEQVLWRCASEDRDATVARSCAEAPATVTGADDVTVYVVVDGRTEPTPGAPFALVLPDGTMRLGVTDRRGAAFEASAPRGSLHLAVPAALAR